MNFEEKVLAVETLFEELDQEITQFQSWSGIHCKLGCGKCCFKADIEATILEFIPFAQFLYKNDVANEWYERIKAEPSSICKILDPSQLGVGLCTQYKHRGLICRLFGFSARTSKHGVKELVTCDIIKTEQQELFVEAYQKIETNAESVPLMHNYYLKLHSIDPDLTRNYYPINQAIKKALETVLAYYSYRDN